MTNQNSATVQSMEIDKSRASWAEHAVLWFSRAIAYVINIYVLAVEAILLLGFLLLLGGANPSSGFVEWVYRSMERSMKPFRGIFAPIELGITGNDVPSIFATSVLFAMIVYGLLAIVVHTVLAWLNGRAAKQAREDEEYRRQQIIGQITTNMNPVAQPPATPPSSTV